MNIGEIRKNANGQLIGSVETLTITRTIGLRPVTSSNPRAPKYEIVALNDQRRWVIVGALFELVLELDRRELLPGQDRRSVDGAAALHRRLPARGRHDGHRLAASAPPQQPARFEPNTAMNDMFTGGEARRCRRAGR
jgi:hypothetical protein